MKEYAARFGACFDCSTSIYPLMLTLQEDNLQPDGQRKGRAKIEREFLECGRAPFTGRDIAVVDLDHLFEDAWTYYTHKARILDVMRDVCLVSKLQQIARTHDVVVVSGLFEKQSDEFIQWLHYSRVPFDHVYLRRPAPGVTAAFSKQRTLKGITAQCPTTNVLVVASNGELVPANIWHWSED